MTSTTPPTTTYKDFEDALEDVHTRFILNLPDSELQTADRIFFQLEQAWWFYEDWICDPHPDWTHLPRYPNFRPFALALWTYSPLLPPPDEFSAMWTKFSLYKRKISNYGCILMSADCQRMVLCRVWNGKSFSFPAGKINQGEDGRNAAARETYEETGFDPSCKFGLTAAWKQQDAPKVTWNPVIQEEDALVVTDDNSGKRRTQYVVVGVPTDFPFEPVARKEVSSVQWFTFDNIPKQSFAVTPFLGPLKKWVKKYKKRMGIATKGSNSSDGATTKTRRSNTPGSRKNTPNRSSSRGSSSNRSRNSSRHGSRGRVIRDDNNDLVQTGLAAAGDLSGWSEDDMFAANEKLSGRRVEYDGNPHVFSEQGFAGNDPHAFHVVGGNFLNAPQGGSSSIQSLAPPPKQSQLQPLFRGCGGDDDEELTPFFSDTGATPWGEVVDDVAHDAISPSRVEATQKKSKKKKASKKTQGKDSLLPNTAPSEPQLPNSNDVDAIFLTDAQVTARSQVIKTQAKPTREEELERQYQEDTEYCRQWVANLPKPRPTKHFGEFKLDVDRIMLAAAPILNRPQSPS